MAAQQGWAQQGQAQQGQAQRGAMLRACRRAFFRMAADLPLMMPRALDKSPLAFEKRVGVKLGPGVKAYGLR